MVMVHGDYKGLFLPPKVAAVQIIVIPVPYKDADMEAIFAACSLEVQTLEDAGFRAEHDFRDNYSPGWKYSNWEMKGVPLRIEIGPKDIAKNQVQIVRRDNGSKADVTMTNLVEHVRDLLSDMLEETKSKPSIEALKPGDTIKFNSSPLKQAGGAEEPKEPPGRREVINEETKPVFHEPGGEFEAPGQEPQAVEDEEN